MGLFVFLLVLSILVIVHEWGHFVTAKMLGVRVEKFSVGFGPKILSRKKGETEFLVSAIPLGGYVKMAGDERAECKGLPEEFFSHPPMHRAAIVLMGPIVNLVFAYLCLTAIFLLGFPGVAPIIRNVNPAGAAQVAGLQEGDLITAVDSVRIYGLSHLERLLFTDQAQPVRLTVTRDGQEKDVSLSPQLIKKKDDFGDLRLSRDLGVSFYGNTIGWLAPGKPAQQAGLREGDRIIQINGQVVQDWDEISDRIAHSGAADVSLVIQRGPEILTKVVPTEAITRKNEQGQEEEIRVIGVGPLQEEHAYRFGLGTALAYAGQELTSIVTMTFKALGRVISGSMSAKQAIGGPIRIFSAVNAAWSTGLASLIYIMAVISASLGIFNLFPIPVLDGGHLFFLTIEQLRGRPLPLKWEEGLSRAGMTLLMMLMAFVVYNDVVQVGWLDRLGSLFKGWGLG